MEAAGWWCMWTRAQLVSTAREPPELLNSSCTGCLLPANLQYHAVVGDT